MIVKELPVNEYNELAASGLITREEYETAMNTYYPDAPKLSAEQLEEIAQSFVTTPRK
jgi:hypothetical protein